MNLENSTAIEDLRKSIDGNITTRASEAYQSKRSNMAWNERIPSHFPSLIIEATSESDVIKVIKFANQMNLSVSPRGSGHSYGGTFMNDKGILLDLSQLNNIIVKEKKRLISVEAGATSGTICEELDRFQLAFPVGHAAPVAIGGFLLGGGLGVNCSAWGGMSTFNIIAADLITADGKLRHVNKNENKELYWAVRGGGPGLPFVVTRFYLQCYPKPKTITVNTYTVHPSLLPELTNLIDSISDYIDPNLQIMLTITPSHAEIKHVYPDLDRVVVLTTIAFANSEKEALRMQTLLASHSLLARSLDHTENEKVSMYEILLQTNNMLVSKRFRSDNILTEDIRSAVEVIMKHIPSSPSGKNIPLIIYRGNTDLPDAAFSVYGRYFVSTYAQWDSPEDDTINETWLHSLYDELSDMATGSYINEYDIEGRSESVDRCYSLSSWGRLHRLRQHYDPNSVFRIPFPIKDLAKTTGGVLQD